MFKDIVEYQLDPKEKFNKVGEMLTTALCEENFIGKELSEQIGKTIKEDTHIVSDDEFNNLFKATIKDHTPTTREMVQANLTNIPAMALSPSDSVTGRAEIYFKESFVYEQAESADLMTRVYLEEIAHTLSNETETLPLSEVEDGSGVLAPYSSKENFMGFMNLIARFLELKEHLRLEDMYYKREGFQTFYYFESEGEMISIPGHIYQEAFEESRALILQTILASKLRGYIKYPEQDNVQQFLRGLNDLMSEYKPENDENESEYYLQPLGVDFVASYLMEFNNSPEDIKKLITDLNKSNFDEFVIDMDKKTPNTMEIFIEMVKVFEETRKNRPNEYQA